MISVSAPGKMVLSGEWGVLEKGVPCIVLALDKRVVAKIGKAEETSIYLKDFKIKTSAKIKKNGIEFSSKDKKLIFTKSAIETALKYLEGKKIKAKNFSLQTESEISVIKIDGERIKPGFGGSAAATVAICNSVLKFHGVNFKSKKDLEKLFKLSVISHYLAQGKIGSGFDIAAAIFGGALYYKRFDPGWLKDELSKKNVFKIADGKWPSFEYKNLDLPQNFQFAIGFSGKSASTKELVQNMEKFKNEKKEEYEKLIFWLKEVTENLKEALNKNEGDEVLTLIDENRDLLKELGQQSGNELEIAEHSKMIKIASNHYAAAKFSGAGGGDCVIAVSFDPEEMENVKNEWKENGFLVIEAKISTEGVRVEK